MPYVSSQGIRIYYQPEGQGAPLVLQHGWSDSLESWYEFGYVNALQSDSQLVLVDARGHGHSEKPHDPEAYAIPCFTADVVAVLGALALAQVHFFGYSMGGWIGFGMAKHVAARIHTLILGGMHPYPPPPATADPWIPMLQQGPEGLSALWNTSLSESLRARLVKNDAEALVALRHKRAEHPSHEDVLPTMTMPCLLFAGAADPNDARVKTCVTHMPNATLMSVPGLGHAETFFQSHLVLPRIQQFLSMAHE